jgi:phosphoglycolate phosphatase-like HAD superfamily hydrolase
MVVSTTPYEALEREWAEHDIAKYVELISGQEMGTKPAMLGYATKGKYEPGHILMIGDGPGTDMRAAKENNAFFYPINPGHEEESWKRFYEEAFDKFIEGTYAGQYQEMVIEEFNQYLPEDPPWSK